MKIGIFGGTFDPPHQGHLNIALSAIKSAMVDEVIFIPASNPPHKSRPDITSDIHRLRMTQAMVAEYSNLSVSDIEIRRKGLSYTILTLKELKSIYPTAELRLIIGADMALLLDLWRNPQEIIDIAPPLIALRPGYHFDEQFGVTLPKGLGEDYRKKLLAGVFEAPQINISSTELRELLKSANAHPIPEYICDSVYNYIKKHKLYKNVD